MGLGQTSLSKDGGMHGGFFADFFAAFARFVKLCYSSL